MKIVNSIKDDRISMGLFAGLLLCLSIVVGYGITRSPGANSAQTKTEPRRVRPSNRGRSMTRNLALQPEAAKLARKIGNRFSGFQKSTTALSGTLEFDGQRQSIQILRRQSVTGERVEVSLNSAPPSLSWDEKTGPRNSGESLTEQHRSLLERLVLDNVDQFVLSQLRGASYRVVGQNVRADNSGGSENYDGPLWTVVRVDDPERDETKRPVSRWRLYYINSETGLIDKIVSEEHGRRIEAILSDWTEENGEHYPKSVSWKQDEQVLMTLSVGSLSSTIQPEESTNNE